MDLTKLDKGIINSLDPDKEMSVGSIHSLLNSSSKAYVTIDDFMFRLMELYRNRYIQGRIDEHDTLVISIDVGPLDPPVARSPEPDRITMLLTNMMVFCRNQPRTHPELRNYFLLKYKDKEISKALNELLTSGEILVDNDNRYVNITHPEN